MLAAELPKVTDWMQAWGSLLGVGVSTLAVIITGLLLRHELRARRQDQEDGEAAQARLIAIGMGGIGVDNHGNVRRANLRLQNYSSAPIYDVYMELRDGTGELPDPFPAVTHDGDTVAFKRLVPPGDTFAEALMITKDLKVDPNDLLIFGEVYVRFFDAAGLAWSKTGTSAPVRLRGRPQANPSAFWPLLWDYVWPISGPIRYVRQLSQRMQRRTAKAQASVILHMGRSVSRRNMKRAARSVGVAEDMNR